MGERGDHPHPLALRAIDHHRRGERIEQISPAARDLPTQPGGFGGIASQQSLERLLREGRPEFSSVPWTPHRPPRPEKSEGGSFVIASDFEPKGDQPQAIKDLVEGVNRTDRTQVCSASPARARLSRWRT